MDKLVKLSELEKALISIDDPREARRYLSISEGLLTSINREYRASLLMSEVKEDRDKAYSAAIKAAEIRLKAEAKLGELLKQIELPGRGGGDTKASCTDATRLSDLGIEKTESFRAQRIYEHQDLIPQVVEKAKERGDLPTRSLLEHEIMMNKENALKSVKFEMQLPSNQTYKTIVIDPPWPVEKIQREERPRQDVWDYPKIPLKFLEEAEIERLADYQGCHLYLWTTHRYLPNAFDMVLAWGFKYQCLLTWVKNVGMTPFSWMYSTEHILFCRKGNLPLLQLGKRLDFAAKVREHSRKPEIFYDLVREVSPEPRLDMFSREKREGFDAWGNEINKF